MRVVMTDSQFLGGFVSEREPRMTDSQFLGGFDLDVTHVDVRHPVPRQIFSSDVAQNRVIKVVLGR